MHTNCRLSEWVESIWKNHAFKMEVLQYHWRWYQWFNFGLCFIKTGNVPVQPRGVHVHMSSMARVVFWLWSFCWGSMTLNDTSAYTTATHLAFSKYVSDEFYSNPNKFLASWFTLNHYTVSHFVVVYSNNWLFVNMNVCLMGAMWEVKRFNCLTT